MGAPGRVTRQGHCPIRQNSGSMKWQKYFLPFVILAILGIFVAYPTISVLWESFKVDGEPGLDNYGDIFTQPHLYETI